MNSGQTCVAPGYLLVPESLKEKVVEKLLAKLSTDYADKSIGKVVSARQIKTLASYLTDTQGKIVSGGEYDEASRQFAATHSFPRETSRDLSISYPPSIS